MPIVEYLSYSLANKSWNYMDNMIEKGQEKNFFRIKFFDPKKKKKKMPGKNLSEG